MNHGLDLRKLQKFRKISSLPENKVKNPIHHLPNKRQGSYKTVPDDYSQNPIRKRNSSVASPHLFTRVNFNNTHQQH